MTLGFRGEVAELCHRFRRGYPPAVFDAFGLGRGTVPPVDRADFTDRRHRAPAPHAPFTGHVAVLVGRA